MPITPVDYNPFAAQYGTPSNYTDPRRRQPPQVPQQASTMPAPGLEEPLPFDQPAMDASRRRMDSDPGVRTARGLVTRGQQAQQDMAFRDLRRRFANNPQALSMLKYLEAQQRYEGQVANTLKAAQLRGSQPMDTLPNDPASVVRPGELQQMQRAPIPRMQPQTLPADPSSVARPGEYGQVMNPPMQRMQYRPGQGIPQQQNYAPMRPRPGMVVNGYRLVNPAKPNDRASWQPVTEK